MHFLKSCKFTTVLSQLILFIEKVATSRVVCSLKILKMMKKCNSDEFGKVESKKLDSFKGNLRTTASIYIVVQNSFIKCIVSNVRISFIMKHFVQEPKP